MKILPVLATLILFNLNLSYGQKAYKNIYKLPQKHFNRTFLYPLGNATIFIDQVGLIEHFKNLLNYPEYYNVYEVEIKNIIDSIASLSNKNDSVNIYHLFNDPGLRGSAEAYLMNCITNKKANIFNAENKSKVKKIYTKEFSKKGNDGCTFSGFEFYLPNTSIPFKSITTSIAKPVKYL
jgi:hypothetical protein